VGFEPRGYVRDRVVRLEHTYARAILRGQNTAFAGRVAIAAAEDDTVLSPTPDAV